MRKQGKVVRWDSVSAFGFIWSPETPADIYFHINDFRALAIPQEGISVSFEEIHVGEKGPRAMAVSALGSREPRITGARPWRPTPATGGLPRHRVTDRSAATSSPRAPASVIMLLMLGWTMLVLWGIWSGQLPLLTLAAMPILNLLTFYVYWSDKHAAQTGR